MRRLHIIMPMGGEASRFKKTGCFTPKPLIEANGIPLYKRALKNTFLTQFNPVLTCIVRDEHVKEYGIDKILKDEYNANIVTIDKTTRGAVETCMLAEHLIEDDDVVLVLDCDLEFNCSMWKYMMWSMFAIGNSVIDGVLVSFDSDSPRYSYAKTSDNRKVIETAEKNPISNNALIGAYCFGSGADFKKYAQELIDENNLKDIKEFYTSLLYNKMIRDGKNIYLAKIGKHDMYNSFGTPEELKEYEDKHNNN